MKHSATYEIGEQLTRDINASFYVECSSNDQTLFRIYKYVVSSLLLLAYNILEISADRLQMYLMSCTKPDLN